MEEKKYSALTEAIWKMIGCKNIPPTPEEYEECLKKFKEKHKPLICGTAFWKEDVDFEKTPMDPTKDPIL